MEIASDKVQHLYSLEILPVALNFLDMKFQGPQRYTVLKSWAPKVRDIGSGFVQFRRCVQKTLSSGKKISQSMNLASMLQSSLGFLRLRESAC